ERLSRLTLFKGLADTKDDLQLMLSRNLCLPVKNFIRFLEVLASLRMADNNVAAPGLSKHGWRDLTGICAFLLIEQVLCCKMYGTVCQQSRSSVNRGERRRYNNVDVVSLLHERNEFVQERPGFRRGLIHLPVGSYTWLAHLYTLYKKSVERQATKCPPN